MKHLKLFEQFEYQSVGIVFIYKDMVLLTHSTNFPEDTWSYPKGHVDNNENLKEAAIREIYEELSIKLPDDFLHRHKIKISLIKEKEKGLKHYKYFKHHLSENEFNIYFDSKYEVDKSKLQLEEIDQAKFFKFDEAIPLLGELKTILE